MTERSPEKPEAPAERHLPLLWLFLFAFAVWRALSFDVWGAVLGAILSFCAFVRPGPTPSPPWKRKAFVLGVAALAVNIALAVVVTLRG